MAERVDIPMWALAGAFVLAALTFLVMVSTYHSQTLMLDGVSRVEALQDSSVNELRRLNRFFRDQLAAQRAINDSVRTAIDTIPKP